MPTTEFHHFLQEWMGSLAQLYDFPLYVLFFKLHLPKLLWGGPKIRKFSLKRHTKERLRQCPGTKSRWRDLYVPSTVMSSKTAVCLALGMKAEWDALVFQGFHGQVEASWFLIRTYLLLPHAVRLEWVIIAALLKSLPKGSKKKTHTTVLISLGNFKLLLTYTDKNRGSCTSGTCRSTTVTSVL